MCTTPNLHRNLSLSWPHGTLSVVHKGICMYHKPLNGLLSGEGTSRKSERVLLLEDALRAFDALKQTCVSAPVLAFADYTKEFLLETDASKEGLGAVLSQNQADG